ncbi:hypothetical protein QMM87_08900, partial [Leptospira santarosai]|nr:hypothetical protein [Leptospira santarosai]
LLDSVESRISHRTALCSRNILIYGSQRPLTLFAELNDTTLYGSQRPLTLFAELNDTALYGSQRPLTLFAELNDTALYGSQRQVLGHDVKYL